MQHYNSLALEKKCKLSVAAACTYVANETMKQHGSQRPAIYSYGSLQSYLIQNNLAEPSTATKVASCPSTIDLVIQLKDDNKRKAIPRPAATTTHAPHEKKKKGKAPPQSESNKENNLKSQVEKVIAKRATK